MNRDDTTHLLDDAREFALGLRERQQKGLAGHEGDAALYKSIDILSSDFNNRELVNWRRARLVIEHENLLINHRLTWLFLVHAALFPTFAALFVVLIEQSYPNAAIVGLPILFIVGLGISFSYNVFRNLRNADRQISEVTKWWRELGQGRREHEHPNIMYSRNDGHSNNQSGIIRLFERLSIVSRLEAIPIYFITFWLFLVAAAGLQTAFPKIWDFLLSIMQAYGVAVGALVIYGVVVFYAGIAWTARIARKRQENGSSQE